MWFRPGHHQSSENDRFRVSSFKKRIRGRAKSPPVKSSSLESENTTSIDEIDNCDKNENNAGETIIIKSSLPPSAQILQSTKSQQHTAPPPLSQIRKLSKSLSHEKEKTLLTDRKFKNNRVVKSSSKGKLNDLEKRGGDTLKTLSTRKISAPPILDGVAETTTTTGVKIPTNKKHSRTHSNLNLNALYKLVSSNKKLSSEDFERIRRKSISEVAATTPKKTSVEKTSLSDSCSEKFNSENGNYFDNPNDKVILRNYQINGDHDDHLTNNENSNSEVVFHENHINNNVQDVIVQNNKKSSPSLTSRVAAKITETTNNYKNRKSKTPPKKRKNSRRSEFYKQISVDRPHSTSIVRQPSDRRPDITNTGISSSGSGSHNTSELVTSQSLDTDSSTALDAEQDAKRDRSKSKSAPVSVNRSESYKERLSQKRNRNNRRKTSDPSLSKTTDEQSESTLSNANYTASSNSSISSSNGIDSPSTSLEQVGGPGAQANISSGPMITATGTIQTPRQWVDSEDEAELAEVDWSSNISTDILATLSDAEKKRQEIINEIYQTERNHVRTLRLLEGIFMGPLQESGALSFDHLHLLFPPELLSLRDLHSSFEQKLKQRRIEHGHIVQNVGDLLVGMFEGKSGDKLREYAAQFCARQQIALEALKEKRRKDENLQRLLTKAESHKACRRLQLKDLLPTVLQRLTKYPLLFESLTKISKRVNPDDKIETDAIQRALDSSKRILVDVNQAVKIAEDAHKLQTIQRKLDKSNLDKDANNEFKTLDLTKHRLIHDGQLTMKKNPCVQLQGLLFENMMVLLQKQDDKYLFKHFPNLAAGNNDNISPITHFDQQTLVRQSAVDKNTFFLIITKTSQMLELTAPSSSECKIWFKHISDAAEQYKPRSKNSHEVVEDPASTTLPHSKTQESLENTPERTTSASASSNNNSGIEEIGGGHHKNHQRQNINYDQGLVSNSINCTENNSNDNDNPLENQKDRNYENNNKNNTNIENDSETGDDENDDDHKDKLSVRREDSRRDSVYSNNSNNTRTLMQHCPLLEPTEIQISISPAHTAEPVLTPTERLKRLDESIRERLSEKQKIICDMFRVPNEHFTAIADIAGQPEAQNDSSDIVLAAFAQVQSLTEVLNEYMKITPEQEISAVSTAVCDQCHRRNLLRSISPLPSSIGSTNTATTVISGTHPQTPVNKEIFSDTIIQDDDGYCEIDELRLPSVMSNSINAGQTLTIGDGLPPISSTPQTVAGNHQSMTSTPELIKRQSTISTDSIPEESEQDIINNDIINISKGEELSMFQSEATASDEQQMSTSDDTLNSEHIEVNDNYGQKTFSNHPIPAKNRGIVDPGLNDSNQGIGELCGPNRFSHVHSLEPSVPCHILNGFVTALSSQITLLLPKINERDLERERLRRENQHLRELLNSMHERQRVEEEKETPENTKSAEKDDNVPEKTDSSTSSPERD